MDIYILHNIVDQSDGDNVKSYDNQGANRDVCNNG